MSRGGRVKTNKRKWWGILFGLLIVLILCSCKSTGGEVMPLAEETYTHPSGIFTLPIPEGWSVSAGETPGAVWLKPPEDGPDVSVMMIAEVLPGETEEEMGQMAQILLEDYMATYLPYQDYEIYNSAEVRVAKNPALVLDFARPMEGGYHVGRMELIYLPGHLVYLAGFGPRADWDAFLPTFRKMVDGMTFSVELLPQGGE
jgi:hypothetical protein